MTGRPRACAIPRPGALALPQREAPTRGEPVTHAAADGRMCPVGGRPANVPAMPRLVALLRAINVGGHVVTMERLRALFADLPLANVESFIASGNVIFDAPPRTAAPALESRIERSLGDALGYAVDTFLRTPAELAAAADARPFGARDPLDDGHALTVIFAKATLPAEAHERLRALATDDDEFAIVGREAYWLRRGGRVSESKVTNAKIERALGGPATARNVTTVRKLAAKYAGA